VTSMNSRQAAATPSLAYCC